MLSLPSLKLWFFPLLCFWSTRESKSEPIGKEASLFSSKNHHLLSLFSTPFYLCAPPFWHINPETFLSHFSMGGNVWCNSACVLALSQNSDDTKEKMWLQSRKQTLSQSTTSHLSLSYLGLFKGNLHKAINVFVWWVCVCVYSLQSWVWIEMDVSRQILEL